MHKTSKRLGRWLGLPIPVWLAAALIAPAAAQTVPMDSAFLSSATYLPAYGTDVYVVGGGTTLLAIQNTTLNNPVTTLPAGALSIDASTYTVNFAAGSGIFNVSGPVTIESSTPGSGLVLMNNGIAAASLTINQTTLEMGNGSALFIVGGVVDDGTFIFNRTSVPAALDVIGPLTGTGSLQLVALASAPLQITDASGFTGTTTIGSGTTLEVTVPMSANITDNGALIFVEPTISTPVSYAYTISGSGTVNTEGYTTFTANQSYTGDTIVDGTLQLGNGGTAGSVAGNVQDYGTLAFDRSDTYTFAGNISGDGGVAVLGSGTVILTGNNTFDGSYMPSQILAGTL
jgi:fibronectin-binding autotransporter adhesin